MRGVVSAGMGIGLELLGLRDVFDGVFGASAGAINGAYFVAGHIGFGTTIYYENINSRDFIDFRRLLVGRPLVDVDYAVFEAVARLKPLDVGAVVRSDVPLHVLATNVQREAREVLERFADGDALLKALRASSTMPVVAGMPYRIGRYDYWDAALLADAIPVTIAEERGFTHILTLLTRPAGVLRPDISAVEKALVVPKIRRVSSRLAEHYLAQNEMYARVVEYIDSEALRVNQPRILAVRPTVAVKNLECGAHALVAGAKEGIAAIMSIFADEPTMQQPVLGSFTGIGKPPLIAPLASAFATAGASGDRRRAIAPSGQAQRPPAPDRTQN